MFTDEKFTKIGGRTRTVYENVIKIQAETFGKSTETFIKKSIRR